MRACQCECERRRSGKPPLPIEFGSALINVGGELLLLTLAVFRLALTLVSQTDRLDVAVVGRRLRWRWAVRVGRNLTISGERCGK